MKSRFDYPVARSALKLKVETVPDFLRAVKGRIQGEKVMLSNPENGSQTSQERQEEESAKNGGESVRSSVSFFSCSPRLRSEKRCSLPGAEFGEGLRRGQAGFAAGKGAELHLFTVGGAVFVGVDGFEKFEDLFKGF